MKRSVSLLLALLLVLTALPISVRAAYHPNATLTGIDISEHQGRIDWEKVKADGIDFAIIRCGYGGNYASQDDTWFLYNATECERVGIPYGVYLYSYATSTARASSEADHVLRLLEGRTLFYPVYFDMEDASTIGSDLAAIAKTFCNKISAAGYPVGVYASLNWWNNYLTDPCFNNWHRWVAQYNSSCQYSGTYAMWQYTSSGAVDGIEGRVDMNFLIGSPTDHGTAVMEFLYTDKTTYQSGEAILTTASCSFSDAWVAVYGADDSVSAQNPSYYWYYVNGSGADYGSSENWVKGKTYNLYDGICNQRNSVTGALPPGEYKVLLLKGNYETVLETQITVVLSTDEPSLQTNKTVYLEGESILVDAISYKNGAWVGIYPGEPSEFGSDYIYYYYTNCNNGLTMSIREQTANSDSLYLDLPAGTYTVALFGDSSYTSVEKTVTVTVSDDKLTTNKTTYSQGEPIYVTTNYSADNAWVGLYREGETFDPGNGGKESIYWYYIADAENPMNILAATAQREQDYGIGRYRVVLFADEGYTALESVTITVAAAEIYRTVVVEPDCTEVGILEIHYSDGSVQYDIIPKTDHSWVEATCTEPKTCKVCGTTEGSPNMHDWTAATCTEPKTCKVCGTTEGSPNMHDWTAATCTEPKVCKVCGTTEGSPNMHDWTAATCTEPKTCKVCGATDGSANTHDWTAATCTEPKVCKVCGVTEGSPVAHSWDMGEVTKEPTTSETGIKTFTCVSCGAVCTEELPQKEMTVTAVIRVFGDTRYDTAFQAADMLKLQLGLEKFPNIVVACGTDFADALSGSYLANQKSAPVLLVRNRKQEMDAVKEYIKANLAEGGTVYLLGGINAVPEAMESGLEGFTVKRLEGETRYETNLAILNEAGCDGKDVLVCTGKDFADGLSASAVNLPILLVKDTLTDAQKEFLKCLEGRIYIIGGTSAVGSRIENALKTYGELTRIEGETRYFTSVNIAKTFFLDAGAAVLAYGNNFPDGLSGGSLAYTIKAPLILTTDGKYSTARDYCTAMGIETGAILGGAGLISDEYAGRIFRISAEEITLWGK